MTSTGAVGRIKQQLIDEKKIKGHRGPTHNKTIKGVRRWDLDHVELCAADIIEAASFCPNQTPIVLALSQGCLAVKPGTMVVILTDDAFHLTEQATNEPAATGS